MSTVRRDLDSVVDRMMLDLERIRKELGDEITPREEGTIGSTKIYLNYLLHAMRIRQGELDREDKVMIKWKNLNELPVITKLDYQSDDYADYRRERCVRALTIKGGQ